jgi:hypothetical protein
MSFNINLLKRARRNSGASLGIVIALAFLLIILGAGFFYMARLIGGQRQTDNASDAGILNAANKANVSPAIASGSLPNQSTLPYSDFYPFASQTSSNGSPSYALDDFGRCVARAAIVELNRQIINSSAPNAVADAHAQQEAQVVANIGTSMKSAITSDSTLNSNYGNIANVNNTNFISGQTDLSLLKNISASYVNAGNATNVTAPSLDSSLLPNPASFNSSVIPTVSSNGQNFIAGYTTINAGGVDLQSPSLGADTHLISSEIFSAGQSSVASTDPTVPPNAFQAAAKQAISSMGNSSSDSENNSAGSSSSSSQSSSSSSQSNGPKAGGGSSSGSANFLYTVSSAQTGTSKTYPAYIPGYVDIYNPGTPGSMCSSPDAADPPNVLYNISIDAFNLMGFGVAGAGPVAFVTPPITTTTGTNSLLGGLGELELCENFFATAGYSANAQNIEKIDGISFNKALDPIAIYSGFTNQLSNYPLTSVVFNDIRIASGNFPAASLKDLLGMKVLRKSSYPKNVYNINDFFADYSSLEADLNADNSTLNSDNSALSAAQQAQIAAQNAYNAALAAYNNAVTKLATDNNNVSNLQAQISWNQAVAAKDAAAIPGFQAQLTANSNQHAADNTKLDSDVAAYDAAKAEKKTNLEKNLAAIVKADNAACRADQNQFNAIVAAANANNSNMALANSIVASAQAALPGAQGAITQDQSAVNTAQAAVTAAQNALNAANAAISQDNSNIASQTAATNNAISVSGKTAQEFLNYGTDGWQVFLNFVTPGQQQQEWNVLVSTNAVATIFDKNSGNTAATALVPFDENDFDGQGTMTNKYPWLYTIANNIVNLLPPATTTPSSRYIIDAVTSLKQKVNQARAQGKVEFTFNMPTMTDLVTKKSFVGLISGIAKYDRFASGSKSTHVIHRVLNGGLNWGNGKGDTHSVQVAPSPPFSSDGTAYEIITQILKTANGPYPASSQAMGCNNTSGDHSFNANDPRYQKMLNLLAFMVQEISLKPHTTTDIVNALNSVKIPLGTHMFLQEVNGQLVMLPTYNGTVPNIASDSSWGANDSVIIQTGFYKVAGGNNPTKFNSCPSVAAQCAEDALVDSTPGDGNTLGDDGTHDNPIHCMGTPKNSAGASVQENQVVGLGLNTGYGGQVGTMILEDQLRVTPLNGWEVEGSINFFHPN